MNRYVLLLLATLCFRAANAQNPLHDALLLRPYFDCSAPDQRCALGEIAFDTSAVVQQILSAYLQGREMSTFNINEVFEPNPFLDIDISPQIEMEFLRSDGETTTLPADGLAGRGFSVGAVADGLARFLVKRTKEELTLAFFDDFRREVQNNPLLRDFFPQTAGMLAGIGDEIYQFQLYLEGLREAFLLDLRQMPGSTENYLRNLPPNTLKITPAERAAFLDILHVAQLSIDGNKPADLLHYLASPEGAIRSNAAGDEILTDFSAGLRTLDLLVQSLRRPAGGPDSLWYSAAELRDPIVLRIYLGLFWQRLQQENIAFFTGAPLHERMAGAALDQQLLAGWQQEIVALQRALGDLQRLTAQPALGGADSLALADRFANYNRLLINLFQTTNRVGRQLLGFQKDLVGRKYLLVFEQGSALYFNVRQKHYNAAVANATVLLTQFLGDDFPGKSVLLRYGTFIASVGEARTPEEVQRAIELFALPPGSSRAKKAPGRFAVALNAYTGLGAGAEYLRDEVRPKGVVGVSAPLGLSCSWGLPNKSALGFFVPIIDVGALTAYRFKDDAALDLPDLTWSNLFAPGAYLVYDFRGKMPFAAGFGAQVGPNLRKVDDTGMLDIDDASGWRLGGFLTVDIPITYFHLSGGKK